MTRSMRLTTLALAALFVAPVGAAQWYSYGSYEPDTSFDTPTLMWSSPPGDEVRVYFGAYTGPNTLGSGVINPNVGALQTHIENPAYEWHLAVLGIWTDCNGDGYVGIAETAAREYPSQLLLDATRCPAATGTTGTCWKVASPCPNWPATGYNNARGWVTELIPIVGPTARNGGDARLIRDPAAAVWGDYGNPHQPPTEPTCAITPLPRGTLQTTGGMLTYADCRAEATEPTADVLGVYNQADATLGLGMAFSDDDDGTSGPLGQVKTLGDDDSSNAIVKAQDCSSDPVVRWGQLGPVGAAIDAQTESEGIRAPSTDVNPFGTVAGTVNYTTEGLPLPTRQTSANIGPSSTSNCDFSDDRGEEPYNLLEGDFVGTSSEEKRQADWNFNPTVGTRGGAPFGVAASGASGAPNDLGLNAVAALCLICGHTEWTGDSTRLSKPGPNTVRFRTDVQGGDVGADVDGAYWLSFYAVVGEVTTGTGAALPGGGLTQKYGAFQCGENESGIFLGWDCDKSTWNLNADGSPIPDPGNTLAYPGKLYNLRDVDCYDGRIGNTGVGVLPAFYGPAPCT